MGDDLALEAQAVLANLPCSITMPAGTGKTQLVVAMARQAAKDGEHCLVLTHTNAGVDALRKRLSGQVDPKFVHVDTLTAWAIKLVRHYPTLTHVAVPATVDTADSSLYIAGAATVAAVPAIKRMHQASFRYLFVDEYQDCTTEHHAFVRSLAAALPRCAVLGDPLQGIFDFDGPLVDWSQHVLPLYPDHARDHVPWRWRGHNDALGQWLLDIRGDFQPGGTLDLTTARIPGLEWQQLSTENEIKTAYNVLRRDGSVVLLHQLRAQHKTIARRTKGAYSIMEALNGGYMREQLMNLDASEPEKYAKWLAMTAKDCFSGLGKVDKPVLHKLGNNDSIAGLKRPTVPRIMEILEGLRLHPTLAYLHRSMNDVNRNDEACCYAHEAWSDMKSAVGRAAIDGTMNAAEHLAAIRNRLRFGSRKPRKALLSRTLLVKGLEYDHVIIANAEAIGDHKDLYVALTRPRKTLTILSASPKITLT